MAWENNRPTHVPTALRDACLQRDGLRCTVTQQDGTRCPEVTDLQAAHITQWQPGETTTLDNLITKCHWHHNLETQQQAREARKQRKPKPSATRPTEVHPALR